jgi:hypothetical protein
MKIRGQVIFLLVFVCVLSMAGFTGSQLSLPHNSHPAGAVVNPGLFIGSRESHANGWHIPANTLILTSYITNESMSGFINGAINVIPYGMTDGATLFMGLYVNGQLRSSSNYTISSYYRSPASMVGAMKSDWAIFTNSFIEYNVALVSMKDILRIGSTITVTLWTSHPLWVQFDSNPATVSHETNIISSGMPITITNLVLIIAPHTITVGVTANVA